MAGLSTSELAELTGTTRQTINSLENGKTRQMNGALLVATKAVLSERAANNEKNSFNLALLKIAIDLLFELKFPSGRKMVKYEFVFISDAFLAVAKIMEANLNAEVQEELAEAIFMVMLRRGIYDSTQVYESDGTYKITDSVNSGGLYESSGLADFFAKRREDNEQRRREIRDIMSRPFLEQEGE